MVDVEQYLHLLVLVEVLLSPLPALINAIFNLILFLGWL